MAYDGDTIRQWAGQAFDFERYGYPLPSGNDPDPLDRVVAGAVAYVEGMTGRDLDPGKLPDEGALRPLADDAVLMRTQQRALGSRAQTVTNAVSGALKSFRAGDYQETRMDPGEIRKAGLINPWADLAELLWLLATPEKRAELQAMLSGTPAPAMIGVSRDVGDSPVYGYWD